jgi:hypothetical protein
MNSIRSQIFGGEQPERRALIGSKRPRGAKADTLHSIAVTRAETRTSDTRSDDRHRLVDETVRLTYNGRERHAELVNLSGGGAMISADFTPMLWDRIDLHLGENGTIECAVRWIKGDRIGLEFAHETRLDCSPAERDALLNAVLARSFADIVIESSTGSPADAAAAEREHDHRRSDSRHPLIWSGHVHFNHDSTPVRLRNISAKGALIECSEALPVGAGLLLDLGAAGSIFGKVAWTLGDQAGLTFDRVFDLGDLAQSRPEVAPAKWNPPAHLRDGNETGTPWDDQWGRMSLSELQDSLEGFLKR